MIGADIGTVRPRRVDLVDEVEVEEEEEEEDVCVTVRLPSGSSAYVVMEVRDTVADLNTWIEKTQGMPRDSFVLSHNGEYLTRRRPMATVGPARVLYLTSRTEPNGAPRGMLVLRHNSCVKRKG